MGQTFIAARSCLRSFSSASISRSRNQEMAERMNHKPAQEDQALQLHGERGPDDIGHDQNLERGQDVAGRARDGRGSGARAACLRRG